jgi:uncharacterized protein YerC
MKQTHATSPEMDKYIDSLADAKTRVAIGNFFEEVLDMNIDQYRSYSTKELIKMLKDGHWYDDYLQHRKDNK